MARILKIVFILTAFSVSNCYSQLNESDSIKFQMKFSSTGSYLDGNVNRLLLLNKLELALANNKWGISSRNDYQYGRTFHTLTENDISSWNFIYLKPLNRVYPYIMFLYETNYRREIIQRLQPGLGLSYNAIHDNKNHLLKLSLTGSYETSKYEGYKFQHQSDTSSNQLNTWRATARLFGKHKLFKDKVRVSYEFWFQQSVTEKNNYRYFNEESIEFPISKYFAFKTGFRYTFENLELQGKKPYDLFWTYGITISNF